MVAMRLFVSQGRQLHNLLVDSDDVILSVKEQLKGSCGIPIEQQELIWNGNQLEDDKQFRYYGIKAGGFFDLKSK